MSNRPPMSVEAISRIPVEVWHDVFQRLGDKLQPLDHTKPLKQVRLDPSTAQQVVDRQRHRFKLLIRELFPFDRVEAFLTNRLNQSNFPALTPYDMREKFIHAVRELLATRRTQTFEPFDLQFDRSELEGSAAFAFKELDFAIRLLEKRPAIILSILFLRKFLVEYAFFIKQEAKKTVGNPELLKTIEYFCDSWNQNTYIKAVYPAFAIHVHAGETTEDNGNAEPLLDRELSKSVMDWLIHNGRFLGTASIKAHGYSAKLSCAATGFVSFGIGKKGWLNLIYDAVLRDCEDSLMIADLERVRNCGRHLLTMLPAE